MRRFGFGALASGDSIRPYAGAFDFFHRRIVEKAFAALEAFLIVDATDFDFSLAMVRRVPSTPHGAKPAAGADGALCQSWGDHDKDLARLAEIIT
jgi:hypothetical protein